MTTAVYMAIPRNCVPLEYKVKTFPVSATILNPKKTNEENKKKKKNISKSLATGGFEPTVAKPLVSHTKCQDTRKYNYTLFKGRK